MKATCQLADTQGRVAMTNKTADVDTTAPRCQLKTINTLAQRSKESKSTHIFISVTQPVCRSSHLPAFTISLILLLWRTSWLT